MKLKTHGQAILISGGSRGLGLYLAQSFLEAGNRVSTFARKMTPAVTSLLERHADDFLFEELDATDVEGLQAFVLAAHRRFGSIDGLVNNAAIGQDELLVHTSVARVQEILQTNVLGPILLTRFVLKRMLLQASPGRIVNISSICGSRGYAGLSVYAASKGAIDAFTRCMAREVGEANILVNSVAPGFFASDMSSVLLPEQMDAIRRRTPTGRLTTEADVLAAVDLLLSSDANIHGQTIPVDGGITV
ncbi:MAG TPA: SDR family oxidoreductase [Dehalococcoidia bacterium]|nr:SDR family oxidoreductase [Dehalococcoidia bacterium]